MKIQTVTLVGPGPGELEIQLSTSGVFEQSPHVVFDPETSLFFYISDLDRYKKDGKLTRLLKSGQNNYKQPRRRDASLSEEQKEWLSQDWDLALERLKNGDFDNSITVESLFE